MDEPTIGNILEAAPTALDNEDHAAQFARITEGILGYYRTGHEQMMAVPSCIIRHLAAYLVGVVPATYLDWFDKILIHLTGTAVIHEEYRTVNLEPVP